MHVDIVPVFADFDQLFFSTPKLLVIPESCAVPFLHCPMKTSDLGGNKVLDLNVCDLQMFVHVDFAKFLGPMDCSCCFVCLVTFIIFDKKFHDGVGMGTFPINPRLARFLGDFGAQRRITSHHGVCGREKGGRDA